MFTIHVETVYDLRLALLPLASICSNADIKCTNERLSIIVVPSAHPFVVSLRMLPTFFTSFQFDSEGNDFEEYRSRFFLKLFMTNICNMFCDGLSLTITLRKDHVLAPLKFEDSLTGYLQYSALILSHPLSIDISPIDFGVFVAIRSAEFKSLVSDLVVCTNELVCVTVTDKEATFTALTREVVLTTENRQCIIGGVRAGSVLYFLITLHPMYFFYHLAYTSKFVWLFKTVSSRNLLSCCTKIDASYLVCF